MVFHLAAPYIVQDQLSLRSWKPSGTLTVRVKYRGPFRLPAVRVSGVLAGPVQERHATPGSVRSLTSGGSSERAKPGSGTFWGSSRAMASSAVTIWNNMVEQHSQRWSQSLQTLQRVGSRILRSMSHDSVTDAADADAGTDGAAGGPSKSGREAAGADQGQHQAAHTHDQQQAFFDALEMSLEEQEAMLQHQLEQLDQLQASLARFVTTASRKEVNRVCMLADLSNIAYDVNQILDGALLESRHGLRLVASSHPEHAGSYAAGDASGAACPMPVPPAGAQGMDSDALTELQHQWDRWEAEAVAAAAAAAREPAGEPAPAATCWEGGSYFHGGYDYGSSAALCSSIPMPLSPRAPVVVSALTLMDESEEAAYAQACSNTSGRAVCCSSSGSDGSAAAVCCSSSCLDAPTAGQAAYPIYPAAHVASGNFAAHQAQLQWEADQQLQHWELQEALGAPSVPAAAPALDAVAPEEPSRPAAASAASAQQQQAAAAAAAQVHPADWFVCDAPADAAAGKPAVRYFVIQGSITVDHWRINLTIDPVPFEDASTAVKVHRGVYAAAQEMYDSLVPMVKEHLACGGPGAKVAFAGHSLGGSLATVLTLLMVHRGDLPAEALESVHTFGAPAVFCEAGAGGRRACDDANCSCGGTAAAAGPHVGALLPALGLDPHAITNVVMHRDIVPRAFVCDYSLVADFMQNWLPSFKGHTGLAACKNHKVLYHFVGDVEVLQPPLGSGFTLPDEGHFMLPPEPALYKLTEPSCPLPAPSRAERRRGAGAGPRALTLSDAILAFMNTPHPLQTLREVRSYGPSGSISRFHNPQNYTDALAALL